MGTCKGVARNAPAAAVFKQLLAGEVLIQQRHHKRMGEKLLYKIRVTGQVQGVGFRWRAAHEAWNTGITGFVKNMADGSVYIEAEGFTDQLNAFVVWCRKGTGTGFVDDVEIDTCPPVNFRDFKIIH